MHRPFEMQDAVFVDELLGTFPPAPREKSFCRHNPRVFVLSSALEVKGDRNSVFGIKPGRLEPGMILARPILLKNGMVLFGEGTELTETYIERIRAMALSCIYVAGDAPLTESRQELLEKLNSRFRGVEQKPYMMLLKRLVEEHLSELYK